MNPTMRQILGATAAGVPNGHAPTAAPPDLAAAPIAPGEWDLLFRAALEQLAALALERDPPAGAGARLQAQGTALRECIATLDQLRRSAPAVDGSA